MCIFLYKLHVDFPETRAHCFFIIILHKTRVIIANIRSTLNYKSYFPDEQPVEANSKRRWSLEKKWRGESSGALKTQLLGVSKILGRSLTLTEASGIKPLYISKSMRAVTDALVLDCMQRYRCLTDIE